MRLLCWGGSLVLLGLTWILLAAPSQAQDLDIDVTQTSLEELANMSITSASRREEEFWRTSSAVYIITAEDIERSGVTSVPDALRLVPGAQVARIDANKYAVSIRGFNSRSANKLLVLIDGRSIYDPLYSGVLWETKDVMLENIERIEVVRGPGGTLWGANAVNGVINIITKRVAAEPSRLLAAGVGTENRAFAQARIDQPLSEATQVRVFARYANRDAGYAEAGAFDESWVAQAGVRVDQEVSTSTTATLQAGGYTGEAGEAFGTTGLDTPHRGAHLMGRWQWIGERADLTVQSYGAYTDINNDLFREERTTADLDLTHHVRFGQRHDIVWGAGFRYTTDTIRDVPIIPADPILPVNPDERTDQLYSAFLQHQLALLDQRMRITSGTKVEHNDYSGIEVQPSLRFSYSAGYQRTWWAAISRAVRTPSRLESDLFLSGLRLGRDFGAEELWAYELGYRTQWSERLFLDVAGFYNRYDDLLTFEAASVALRNLLEATTAGVEGVARWQWTRQGRLEATYAFLTVDAEVAESSTDQDRVRVVTGSDPRHTGSLRASWSEGRWTFDMIGRAVSQLDAFDVPGYVTADVRVAVQLSPAMQLALVGRDLLDRAHFEQQSNLATEVERSVYLKLIWRP